MEPTTVYGRRDEVQLLDVREDDEWAPGGSTARTTSRWVNYRPV